MNHAARKEIVSFIWSTTDDYLRDDLVRDNYRDVILPKFILRRIDCLLEDTKENVLAEVNFQREEAGMAVLSPVKELRPYAHKGFLRQPYQPRRHRQNQNLAHGLG